MAAWLFLFFFKHYAILVELNILWIVATKNPNMATNKHASVDKHSTVLNVEKPHQKKTSPNICIFQIRNLSWGSK